MLRVFTKYEKFFMLPRKTEKSDPNWFGYLLTVKEDSGFSREDIVRHLEKNKIFKCVFKVISVSSEGH